MGGGGRGDSSRCSQGSGRKVEGKGLEAEGTGALEMAHTMSGVPKGAMCGV